MTGKGNVSTQGGKPGDLLLKVVIRPHHYFKRDGINILVTKQITVTQAILGATIKVQTLNGVHTVDVAPGTNDGATIKIAGMGISKLDSAVKGD